MKQFFLQFFTWWHGQTLGTRFYTWRKGKLVGKDEFGNLYYAAQGPLIDASAGTERRWVVYKGEAEASKVPSGWFGWLHHTFDIPPTQENYQLKEWQKPHLENLTGTVHAYRPSGSIVSQATGTLIKKDYVPKDYSPWTPDA